MNLLLNLSSATNVRVYVLFITWHTNCDPFLIYHKSQFSEDDYSTTYLSLVFSVFENSTFGLFNLAP